VKVIVFGVFYVALIMKPKSFSSVNQMKFTIETGQIFSTGCEK